MTQTTQVKTVKIEGILLIHESILLFFGPKNQLREEKSIAFTQLRLLDPEMINELNIS